MKKLIILSLAVLTLAAPHHARAAEYPKMTIMAGSSNPPGSVLTVCIDKFKEVMEKESGGSITVKTFYSGVFGDEQAYVKQVRGMGLHLATCATGNLTPFSPRATINILPYMFPTIENAKHLLGNETYVKELGDAIAAESKVRPLGWILGGYRIITNSKKPIKSIADLQGLKLRVPPVAIQLDSFRAWGVEPHPLAWSETFNALQQGVVDGQENPHSVNRDQKFWEVQKYISVIHYMLWNGPMFVNENWYRRLDPNTRALVEKAVKEAVAYEWAWADKEENEALRLCLAKGMVTNDVSDEKVWMEKARALWPAYYDKVGGKVFVDKALKIMAGQ